MGMKLVNDAAYREVINSLDLEEHEKDRLNKRWLHYVLWWDGRARDSKWKYHMLRSIVIVGAASIPALVSLNVTDAKRSAYVHFLTVAISLLVAVCAGLEGLFGFGDIWREKRAAAEILKCQGWRFFQLVKPYDAESHRKAYPAFADAVETMIEHEVKDYLIATNGEKPTNQQDPQNGERKK
jgi:hypothetical protein